jgi:hypothetical protein
MRHETPQETSVQWQDNITEEAAGTVVVVPWGRSEHNLANAHRDGAHIANCDPDTIKELCRLALIGIETERVDPVGTIAQKALNCAAIYEEHAGAHNAGAATALRQFAADIIAPPHAVDQGRAKP